ncbi:MAG: PilX N-terminal domain-containing pilus assembly protein [Bacteroidota bacterium]
MKIPTVCFPKRQRGAALFVSLIILVLLTLVALASLATSLLQLRMSTNGELQATAQQNAVAALDDVIRIDYDARQTGNINLPNQFFNVTGTVPDVNCTVNWSGTGTCNRQTIALTAPLDGTSNGPNHVKVTRLTDSVPTRSACGNAALFEIESIYDKSALAQGKADLIEGYQACDYLGLGSSTGTPIAATSN